MKIGNDEMLWIAYVLKTVQTVQVFSGCILHIVINQEIHTVLTVFIQFMNICFSVHFLQDLLSLVMNIHNTTTNKV